MNLRPLLDWYRRNQRVLPWREEPTPYRVWISEIMLQQTQVVTALPFFERWIQKFPTLESLARAPESEVLAAWSGLGYYSRARNIKKSAMLIHENGFPETREGWLELPGVGEYTAGAVLSIAYNQVEALVDGNVERVFSRLTCLKRDSDYRNRLWELAREWVASAKTQKVQPRDLNQAWMELGATVCLPRGARCQVCPLASQCGAKKRSQVEEYPQKKPKKVWLEVAETVLALQDRKGRLLLRKSQPGEWRSGLWDFPKASEIPQSETWVSESQASEMPIAIRYVVTRHRVSRKIVPVRSESMPTLKSATPKTEWFWWSEATLPLSELGVGSAFKKSLRALRERQ